MSISILSLNIGNPSIERAEKQLSWLKERNEDIFVFTESKESSGCNLIINGFKNHGYNVKYPSNYGKEYGVIIAYKNNIKILKTSEIGSRMQIIKFKHNDKVFKLFGVYVPSNDRKKIERKQKFIEQMYQQLKLKSNSEIILCGDFNTVPPDHKPKYKMFRKWEYNMFNELENIELVDIYKKLYPEKQSYSWYGKSGNGYRYDFFFVSKGTIHNKIKCSYNDESIKNKLSDHSIITLSI